MTRPPYLPSPKNEHSKNLPYDRPTTSIADIDKVVGEIIHCQKMVDFGGADWMDYADKLIKLRLGTLPTLLTALINKGKIEQTKLLQGAQEKFGRVDFKQALYELEDRKKIGGETDLNQLKEHHG